MASSSHKTKLIRTDENEDPSIRPLFCKPRSSSVVDEHRRRDSTAEPDLAGSESAQTGVLTPEVGSDSSDYRDDISPDDSDAEDEMDEGEIDAILARFDTPSKLDFRKVPESKISDGRSWMSGKIFAEFRNRCSVPYDVVIRLPSAEERHWDAPAGYFCVYECSFSWLGLRFPIPQFIFDYCENHWIATSQLSHSVIRHMICCAELAKAMRITFDADFFERISTLRAGSKRSDPFGVGMTHFHTTMKDGISAELHITKIHDWDRYYFFVRNDSASAMDNQTMILHQWRSGLVE